MLRKSIPPAIVIMLIVSQTLSSQNLLHGPDCATYDIANDRYFISNWSAGSIVTIDNEGFQSYFAQGLGITNGSHIVDNTLYATGSFNHLYAWDLTSGDMLWDLYIWGSNQVDGITADNSGNLYLTDYDFAGVNQIFKVNISEQTSELYISSGLDGQPQDLYFDEANNRLILTSYDSPGRIRAIDLTDASLTTLATAPYPLNNGIERDNDGNWYIPCYNAGEVYRYDSDFTDPPTLISSGHSGPTALGFNPIDEILAIPNFNGNRVDFIGLNVDFHTDNTIGWTPLEVNYDGYSINFDVVDDWSWDLDNDITASGQNISHTYTSPGIYDVTLQIEVGEETFTRNKRNHIIALADTLMSESNVGMEAYTVGIPIYVANTLPLDEITIPIEYDGSLDVAYAYFSTLGCRTEHFEVQDLEYNDDYYKQLMIRLGGNLDPGEGFVAIVYFTIESGQPGQTNDLIVDGFYQYQPKFNGTILNLTPATVNGTIGLIDCGDVNGDFAVNLLDIVFLIDNKFKDGPLPDPIEVADVNSDGTFDLLDIVYMIDYKFKHGLEPDCPDPIKTDNCPMR